MHGLTLESFHDMFPAELTLTSRVESKIRPLGSAVKIAFLGISLSSLGWGQAVSTSQINGTIQDQSGSAVPAAQIKVTQTDTGAIRTVVSGPDGAYVIPTLPVGRYSLEV